MTSPDMVRASRQFFENPENYAEFTQVAGGRALLGCIDPRDVIGPEQGSYPIVKQTAGGAVGEGLDGALAMTAMAGRLIPVESGIRADQDLRPESLITAHYRCAFDGAIKDVTAEMADPSDMTKENTERWARAMGHWAPIKTALRPVTEAAKRQQEYLEEQKPMGQLAEHAEETVHVRGENVSKVYVVNLHPELGVNPNTKPRDEAGASLVQGYHDSLGATVEHLRDEQRLSCDTRGLRVGAMVRRAAATQTVITHGKLAEMTLYEAYPDSDAPNGLAIVERKVA